MLPAFNEDTDKWKPYLTKADAYFEANEIIDSARKRALLIAALSTQTVQILAGKVAPRAPNALSFEEVVEVLNEYYDPKRHEIMESFKFFHRCQMEGESVMQFLVEICRIADNCNFGNALDRMPRDRIVCSVRSTALQKQLLAKADLTLPEAEALAISAEAAEKDAMRMSSEPKSLFKLQVARKMPSEGNRKAEENMECGRCGSSKHNDA